jgi:hypothetical protein
MIVVARMPRRGGGVAGTTSLSNAAVESQGKPRSRRGKANKSQGGRAHKANKSQAGAPGKANKSQGKPIKAKGSKILRPQAAR